MWTSHDFSVFFPLTLCQAHAIFLVYDYNYFHLFVELLSPLGPVCISGLYLLRVWSESAITENMANFLALGS